MRLSERVRETSGEFVIWDVGLGAAANILTAFRATRDLNCSLRVLSFDRTLEPLKFALSHGPELQYFDGYETQVQMLIDKHQSTFSDGRQNVRWELHLGDFPSLVSPEAAHVYPAPDAILFDAYSPAKNPAMWTAPLFTNLFRFLNPERPCAMPTYSRSTLLRVTLLLAGFFVGVGHATGEKEETTIAANSLQLLEEPLPKTWLKRARNSRSAEPMWEPAYRQAHLAEATWEKLQRHPQFNL